jgi:hypothetical protein
MNFNFKLNDLYFANINRYDFSCITMTLIFNNKKYIKNNKNLNFITDHYFSLYLNKRFDLMNQIIIEIENDLIDQIVIERKN